MFFLAITLCDNGGTPKVMDRLEDIFVPPTFPHLVSKANHMEVSKVQPKYQCVAMAKLHDLLAQPTIDRANVIHRVVVVHNEEGVVQLKGALTRQYQPLGVLLDFSVQPLMLGKVAIDGLGLIDVDLDPCPSHISTSMGGSKKAQGLTKQKIMIQVNSNKPTDYCVGLSNGHACYIL